MDNDLDVTGVDCEKDVDDKIAATDALVKQGKLDGALEQRLALEEQTRTGANTNSTSRIFVQIVKFCYETKNLTKLNDMVVALSDRRSQMKPCYTAFPPRTTTSNMISCIVRTKVKY